MPTTTIPTITLQVGTREFGPANVSDADSSIVLTIDRTVANGLNATSATHLQVDAMVSLDGGSTWTVVAGFGTPGGQIPMAPPPKGPGGFYTQNQLVVGLDQFPGTGRRIKAVTNVSGASVAIAGTVTTG